MTKVFKRVDGDYHIVSVNANDEVIIDTSNVNVTGNLIVSGNMSYIDVEELRISDPWIYLNNSNTTFASNSGILTQTASSVYAGLRWNETDSRWESNPSTNSEGTSGTWSNISTGAQGT